MRSRTPGPCSQAKQQPHLSNAASRKQMCVVPSIASHVGAARIGSLALCSSLSGSLYGVGEELVFRLGLVEECLGLF
jgi:hypothetical protein